MHVQAAAGIRDSQHGGDIVATALLGNRAFALALLGEQDYALALLGWGDLDLALLGEQVYALALLGRQDYTVALGGTVPSEFLARILGQWDFSNYRQSAHIMTAF